MNMCPAQVPCAIQNINYIYTSTKIKKPDIMKISFTQNTKLIIHTYYTYVLTIVKVDNLVKPRSHLVIVKSLLMM